MQRRTVQDPQRASSAINHRAVRGTVAKVGAILTTPLATLATVAVALAALVTVAASAPPAGAQPNCDREAGPVMVVKVEGLIDPVLGDLIEDKVAAADRDCALALALQLDSGGSVLPADQLDDLVGALEGAEVQTGVWIGPSGSRATDEAVRLVAAVDLVGVAGPGSSIEITPELMAARRVEPADLGNAEVGDRISAKRAVDLGLADTDAATILGFVAQFDGFQGKEVDGRLQPTTQVQFSTLDVLGQLMHTVASPNVAYVLFVLGFALLLFELFTAGVGVAGLVGAGALILGCYGLAVLPTRPLGVALLLFAMFGYGVDVQTGVPRVWTGIATVSFALGSVLLYDGVSASWIAILLTLVGITLAMVAGMPTMVRTRFSTPTIGRDWMIGEMGTARTDIAPDGVVTLREAPWRARTNRATPIRKQEPVRVVAIEGLVLEVEPEEGGARDYRERGPSGE
jgi:membrane-bound serine protease (ClpP class)